MTKIHLDFTRDKEFLLLPENNICGGISSVMGVIGMLYRMSTNKSFTLIQIIYMDWV